MRLWLATHPGNSYSTFPAAEPITTPDLKLQLASKVLIVHAIGSYQCGWTGQVKFKRRTNETAFLAWAARFQDWKSPHPNEAPRQLLERSLPGKSKPPFQPQRRQLPVPLPHHVIPDGRCHDEHRRADCSTVGKRLNLRIGFDCRQSPQPSDPSRRSAVAADRGDLQTRHRSVRPWNRCAASHVESIQ